MEQTDPPAKVASNDQLGPPVPKRCEPCRATGAVHCSDPENCGGPWDKHHDATVLQGMTADDLMKLVNRYTEACDDLGAGLFAQTDAETAAKHAKAKGLHGQILAEVSRLHTDRDEMAVNLARVDEENDILRAELLDVLDACGNSGCTLPTQKG